MLVPPHPHTSLQTVSWLFEGEIEHRDSVGSHAIVRPGELNIMTAGNGIAHSEVSTADRATGAARCPAVGRAAGLRAYDDRHRPSTRTPTCRRWTSTAPAVTVMIGTVAGVTSPAPAYTPLVGADITIEPGRTRLRCR